MNDAVKIIHTRLAPKIGNTSKQAPKVDPALIAKAFGATAVGSTAGLDVFSLRSAIEAMLSSSGGRPSIEGATAQVKIPRIDEDWLKLEKIMQAAATPFHRPSITQTAAVILHVALAKFSEDELEAEVRRAALG
jgi:hypothetical protein